MLNMSIKSMRAFWVKVLVALAAGLIALVMFDLGAYILIPNEGFPIFPAYKNWSTRSKLNEAIRVYPRNYHVADSQMGFDIAPNQPATNFVMPDRTVSIFSNDLGCMDRHTLAEIKQAPSYEYITGDSFTWGYAEYDSKYPTMYEAQTGKIVAKCGVTHSGQAHQFDKFQQVVKRIGYYPKRVIIGYFENDVVNDFVYPHTTIIEGFQVDTAQVNSRYQLVPRDLNQVRKTILQSIDGMYDSSRERFLDWVRAHSLSVNLIAFGSNTLFAKNSGKQSSTSDPMQGNRSAADTIDTPLYSIYKLADNVGFDQNYLKLEITEPNRRAIRHWVKDAQEHSYELIFVLIPTKGGYAQLDSYQGLKQFLQEQPVSYIDLAKPFKESGKPAEYFYWKSDGHWNNEGNVFVGQYLAKQLSK